VRHQWSEVSPQLGSDLNGNWDGGAPEGVVCIGQGQGAWWVRQPTAGLRRGEFHIVHLIKLKGQTRTI